MGSFKDNPDITEPWFVVSGCGRILKLKKKTDNHVKQVSGVFFFDPEDRIYQSHFPGRPVVPGSVIFHAFLDALHQEGIFPGKIGIERFRFHDFVSPGQFPFSVTVDGRQALCELYDGKKRVAKGKLLI
jgi:3-hydroxyacyl-[acyl-carrier-protein] dehydratase